MLTSTLRPCNSTLTPCNSTLRPCNSTSNDTVESLAAKFLRSGPEAEIEVCDSEGEECLKAQYAPRPPLKLKGNTLDLIPFLSNHGNTTSLLRSNTQRVSFDVLRGKHVLVCCVLIPVPEYPEYWLSIKASYYEIPTRDFEMVLVPLTETDSAADEALFADFFDQTPGLAIPFSDTETRHNICSLLGLKSSCAIGIAAIVVDPSGRILHHVNTIEHFLHYGSDFNPFVASHIKSIDAQDDVFASRLDPFYDRKLSLESNIKTKLDAFVTKKPLSLHRDILQCNRSLLLSRFCPTAGSSLTVSELSNTYVGLYICHSMDFLGELYTAYQKCINNGHELEIIVVCLPFFVAKEEVCDTFKRMDIRSWFFFPENDKVSRRLWRIFGRRAYRDRFIIVPPNCISGELEGRLFIEQEEEYPFTRSTVLEKRFTALRSLNPTLCFEGADKKHTCLVRNGKDSNVRQSVIRGKKLLLYLDSPGLLRDDGKFLRRLRKSYRQIKAKGWEVVFIPFDAGDDAIIDKMPWPIMPAHLAARALFVNQLFFNEDYPDENHLIALNEDGKIVSRQAKKKLKKLGVRESLFNDNLYEEIADSLSLLRIRLPFKVTRF